MAADCSARAEGRPLAVGGTETVERPRDEELELHVGANAYERTVVEGARATARELLVVDEGPVRGVEVTELPARSGSELVVLLPESVRLVVLGGERDRRDELEEGMFLRDR